MPPERFSRRCAREFDEETSLPRQTESEGQKTGENPRRSRPPRQSMKMLSYQYVSVAGAPGFEPGITGPKPVALPLGHAPICAQHRWKSRPPSRFSIWQAGCPPTSIGAAEQRHAPAPGLVAGPGSGVYIRPSSDKRSVAQPGSAPRSGRGGRRFKSCHSDHYFSIFYQRVRQPSSKLQGGRTAHAYAHEKLPLPLAF
jgi:hypothetical protein